MAGMPGTGPIVVGVDGRGGGDDALALALALAAPGAPIVVVTATDGPGDLGGDEAPWRLRLRLRAEETLDRARERAGDRAASYEVAHAGSPASALHGVAERVGASLLVVGADHHGPIGRIAAGSVTEQVLHASPCAVAVAPAGLADDGRRVATIGVGYDDGPESRAALATAVDLADRLGARLRLIDVLPTEAFWLSGYAGPLVLPEMRADARRALGDAAQEIDPSIPVETMVLEGDPAALLARAAERLDLLVVGSRGFGPLRRVLLGSVSARLVRDLDRPLVVVPRTARTAAS